MEWEVGGQPELVVGDSRLTLTAWPDPHYGRKPRGIAEKSGDCLLYLIPLYWIYTQSLGLSRKKMSGRKD